jgi:hypothetical protein
MAKDAKADADKRVKDGWIRTWLAVEVVTATKEAAETSLKKHIDMLKKVENTLIYMTSFKEPTKVSHPFKKGEKAFSMVVEVELVAKRFEDLIFIVLNYAPSGIEILEPSVLKVELGEAQGVLNSLAELIHKFAVLQRGVVTVDA